LPASRTTRGVAAAGRPVAPVCLIRHSRTVSARA